MQVSYYTLERVKVRMDITSGSIDVTPPEWRFMADLSVEELNNLLYSKMPDSLYYCICMHVSVFRCLHT